MIYPKNFESKIGFDEIRQFLKDLCLSTLGKEKVDETTFSTDCERINEQMEQIREFRKLQHATEQMPLNYFFDVRQSIVHIRLENTHLEEDELFDLRRSLETIGGIVTFLNKNNGWLSYILRYGALCLVSVTLVYIKPIITGIAGAVKKSGKKS